MRNVWHIWTATFFLMAGAVRGATVQNVTVRARDTFGTDASDVLNHCSVKAGDEYSAEATSRDERTLLDTGRFSDVTVLIEPLDNGAVNVIYMVQRRHRFQEPLTITGNAFLSESKIRKLSELRNGELIDSAILHERAVKIRDEYLKRYFRDVLVKAEIQPIEGSAGFATVTFTIEEGDRQRIKDFTFVNNVSIPASELRSAFGEYPWWNPLGWFSDTPVSDQALEDARQKAEDVYRDAGFLDAKVDFPVVESAGEERINMVFNVTEGDAYTVESVAIRGVTLFPDAEVLASTGLKEDMTGGRKAINDAAKNIRDYYGSRGYADTMVRPFIETVPGRPGRAVITFEVHEGQLAYIRNIIIRGNDKTKDKVIRREILVNPGEVMNEVRVERSGNRLRNLGYFSDVRHYTEKTDADDQRDLVYEVDEQNTGRFLIGAGFSSIDQLMGFLEISQSNFDILNWPNFTGGGQKARFGVEIGTRNQAGEVSWTEPWFLDRPMALSTDFYYRNLWYREFDVTRAGGSVGLAYPVAFGRVGVSYTLEQVDMKSVDNRNWYTKDGKSLIPGADDLGDWSGGSGGGWDGDESRYFKWQKDEFGGNMNSIFRLYWERDARDQIFVPTRGYRAFLFGDLSEGGVGDNQFYKLGANYRHWFPLPWGKHVLSLRGRLETIESYGDNELPIYEKLFLGGPRTVRGVRYRDVGPKAFDAPGYSDHHVPIGGQTLALGSAEYSIPLFKAVRVAAFMDAGSLGEDAWGGSMSSFCVSGGVGLRIDIKGFPIRFDIARPFKRDDRYTDTEVFSFSIGFE
ncbi:MAG: outer membrane protein assembly factor BamA [Kiritimatiellaeota bacterium]|nr:outer membrane protein assembly factor BamA [Kiritimatiellota bacterium]